MARDAPCFEEETGAAERVIARPSVARGAPAKAEAISCRETNVSLSSCDSQRHEIASSSRFAGLLAMTAWPRMQTILRSS